MINYIGITGHADMRIHKEALELYDFDSVLLPVNIGSLVDPHPENDFRPILEITSDRDIGVSRGKWTKEPKYNTWYEPLDSQKEIDTAVWFTLSQEGVTTYSLAGDVRLWPMILDAAKRYKQLDENEQKTFIEYAKTKGFKPLFPQY